MNKIRLSGVVLALASLASCSTRIELVPQETELSEVPDIPVITAILQADDAATKTAFEFPDWRMKVSWTAGDAISITPDSGMTFWQAGEYTLPDGGGTSADFVRTREVGGTSAPFVAFYPADKIKSYPDFTHFFFTGQVQRKADPMAHLADYFLMYKEVNDYSVVDFSDAHKSSCIRVNVSGNTFRNPRKITLKISGKGQFNLNASAPDAPNWWYIGYEPETIQTSSEISVDLEGYGVETDVVAWIAMDMQDVKIYSGDYVIVLVECDDCIWRHKFLVSSEMTLTGGKCHTLTVDSGWEPSPADYTQYEYDGEVITLQENNKGLDLVVMGDGFIAEDFNGGDNSLYMDIMRNAAEQFFEASPYDYLKPFFNVYIVKAVSPERTNAETTGLNGARNTGSETKFSVSFVPYSTSVSGNNAMVEEYAAKALQPDPDGKRLANATMIVIANQQCRSGTCHSGWGGEAYSTDFGYSHSIAYVGRGNNVEEGYQLVRHEAGGHGFGKLADEYSGYSLTNTGPWNTLAQYHPMGFSRNVDRYVNERNHAALGDSYPVTTIGNVYWAELFGTVNNYEQTEGLGVFEGGMVYNNGICRPTEIASNSIMNANTGIFNAPSRRQILYRAKCLMGTNEGSWGSEGELAAFLAWDAEYFQPKVSEYLPARVPAKKPNSVEQYALPLAPPVLVYGRWEGKRFIPIDNEHN